MCSLCNCFRSKELVEVTKMCREMKRMVPEILEVEVDPKGGPGIVEAAMRVYAEKKESVVGRRRGSDGGRERSVCVIVGDGDKVILATGR
ncbi:hypothetical protein HN51_055455 [Arachis hypogaea]